MFYRGIAGMPVLGAVGHFEHFLDVVCSFLLGGSLIHDRADPVWPSVGCSSRVQALVRHRIETLCVIRGLITAGRMRAHDANALLPRMTLEVDDDSAVFNLERVSYRGEVPLVMRQYLVSCQVVVSEK